MAAPALQTAAVAIAPRVSVRKVNAMSLSLVSGGRPLSLRMAVMSFFLLRNDISNVELRQCAAIAGNPLEGVA